MSTFASLPVNVYESQLALLGYGLPLWFPEPDDTQGPVEIGDVGYMFDGSFRKLFNVTKPIDDPNSMPSKFTQLTYSRQMHVISRRRHLSRLVSSGSVKKVNVDVDASVVVSPASATGRVSFQCTGSQGALLVVDDGGADQEILGENQLFPDYMLEHHDSWHEFARANGFSMKPEDIVMVRGTVKARRWLVAAFTGEASELSLQFDAAGGIFGRLGVSLSSSITDSKSPMCRFGPEDAIISDDIADEASQHVDHLPKDQCVFLSRYKLRFRWFRGSKVMKAEGKHRDDHTPPETDDGINDQFADDSGFSRYVEDDFSHRKTLDPVDILLEYILETSMCDTALASDEDVRVLSQELAYTMTAEGFKEHLLSRQPSVIVSTCSGSAVGYLAISDELRSGTLDLPKLDTSLEGGSQKTGTLDENVTPSRLGPLPTMHGSKPIAVTHPRLRHTHARNRKGKNVISEDLRGVKGLVDDAAINAIGAGEYGRALAWLNIGRAVVWSQVVDLHTFDGIRRIHPQLADEFRRVSRKLDYTSHTVVPAPTEATHSSLDAYPQSSHTYALEYDNLIAGICELEGFENLRLPKTFTQLATTCAAGPVVIMDAHETRCDALIVHHPGIVTHVPLRLFSQEQAIRLHKDLQSFLSSRTSRCRFCGGLHGGQGHQSGHTLQSSGKYHSMYKILEDLWRMVVKPILDVVCALPSVADSNLPHITWCPTGSFASLPLHAAGIYSKDDRNHTLMECIMDVAVSSYTPNLEVLLRPRTKLAARDARYPKTLIVSQPDISGESLAKGATSEAGIVMSHLESAATSILHGADGTIDAVLEGMTTHNWVHYACHGVQNNEDASQSSFALHNSQLTLEKLLSKHLPVADLAVFSACQTATGNDSGELPAEALHLAAGMLHVGYKSVVGTTWSVPDDSAQVCMDEFYRVMMEQVKEKGELSPAHALHEATKALREKYGATDFMRWVPYVHFGL